MPYCTLSCFICNELAINCFFSLLSSRRTFMRKQSPAGSWVRRFCLMALSWYHSIGYFSVWFIEKSQSPKACSIDSLLQCKFVIWRSSSIWLQLFKYNSPFADNRELKQQTFFHDGGLHSVRGMDQERHLWRENF